MAVVRQWQHIPDAQQQLLDVTLSATRGDGGLLQGMPIDSSVAELLTAQLFVLVQEAPDPIYFYINSTGIAVSIKLPQQNR